MSATFEPDTTKIHPGKTVTRSSWRPSLTTAIHCALLFLMAGAWIFWAHLQTNEVRAYRFSKAEFRTATPTELVTPPEHSLPFLQVDVQGQAYSHAVELNGQFISGKRSAWIFMRPPASGANTWIEYQGTKWPLQARQTASRTEPPAPQLLYLGELDLNAKDKKFVIGGSHPADAAPQQFGLMAFAPPGMSEEHVLKTLGGKAAMQWHDMVAVLLILGMAQFALLGLNQGTRHPGERQWARQGLIAGVLVALVALTAVLVQTADPAPLRKLSNTDRSFAEGLLDNGVRSTINTIDRLQKAHLPHREQADQVPAEHQSSSGSFETAILSLDQPSDGQDRVSASVFSGKMAWIQDLSAKRFAKFQKWVIGLLLICGALAWHTQRRPWVILSVGLISLWSVFLSIRLSQGWDEFFINLRHAYMLLHHGVYSINAEQMVEASVDFLPLLATAALGSLGVDLIDAFLVTSLIGNVLAISFAYLIVKKLTDSTAWAIVAALAMGLHPNVILVGATGFSAVLFTGWMLAASYFYLFTDRRRLGTALLATLTLVRTEGVLFTALVFAYKTLLCKPDQTNDQGNLITRITKAIPEGVALATPFVASCLVRWLVFGHAIPNPVTFKSTGMDTDYLSAGLGRFTQLISSHDLHLLVFAILFFVCTSAFANRRKTFDARDRQPLKRLLGLVLVSFVFVLPYFIGGGDWFPQNWNRYGMPFGMFALLCFFVVVHRAFNIFPGKWLDLAVLGVVSITLMLGYTSSTKFRSDNHIGETYRALPNPTNDKWFRVDNLSSLGKFLDQVLPPDAVVASPEEATIMYFSNREMLGLLGVSNPDMATMPLQPLAPGDILHRRRSHVSVHKSRPDVIALYEPVIREDLPASPDRQPFVLDLVQKRMFNDDMVNIAYYRVGSFKALELMGYRHLSIALHNEIFSIFVHERIRSTVVERMRLKGFTHLGNGSIRYAVPAATTQKYAPAAPELMGEL